MLTVILGPILIWILIHHILTDKDWTLSIVGSFYGTGLCIVFSLALPNTTHIETQSYTLGQFGDETYMYMNQVIFRMPNTGEIKVLELDPKTTNIVHKDTVPCLVQHWERNDPDVIQLWSPFSTETLIKSTIYIP